jgi:hypothetical protein
MVLFILCILLAACGGEGAMEIPSVVEPTEEVAPAEFPEEAEPAEELTGEAEEAAPDEGEEIIATELMEIKPEASKAPDICVSTADYIWTDTGDPLNWMIKITIPRQKGCIRVDDSKGNLTPAEMSALDTSGHKPVKALINFCVAPIVGDCT